jgi:antitoxin (DNA-binding transcriptional repressor) of toxin-antitoxin stability system
MKTFYTVEEAQAQLAELIARMIPGEELSLTQDGHVVARLTKAPPQVTKPREPGSAQGKILYMADDFDAPLEDFKEYME